MPLERVPFDHLVAAVREHTLMLLGTTIGYSDEDWAATTALTGWTRSHVAAHLVEGARGMVRVVRGLLEDSPRAMYDSQAARHQAIEIGTLQGALDLQIELDTSASELQNLLPQLAGDERVADVSGHQVKASQIPLARLGEVVLHHMDLGSHFSTSELDSDIAVSLLEFTVDHITHHDDYPPLRLVSDEGYVGTVGREGHPAEMHGPAGDLLGWLARGTKSPRLYRANGPSD